MTLKQILTVDVNRILQFDVNRVLLWNVGRALREPVRSSLLKAACGYFIGLMVFGLGSIAIGITASDGVINLLAIALGVVCTVVPDRSLSENGENTNTKGPAL